MQSRIRFPSLSGRKRQLNEREKKEETHATSNHYQVHTSKIKTKYKIALKLQIVYCLSLLLALVRFALLSAVGFFVNCYTVAAKIYLDWYLSLTQFFMGCLSIFFIIYKRVFTAKSALSRSRISFFPILYVSNNVCKKLQCCYLNLFN